jgi:hypothetical protein
LHIVSNRKGTFSIYLLRRCMMESRVEVSMAKNESKINKLVIVIAVQLHTFFL